MIEGGGEVSGVVSQSLGGFFHTEIIPLSEPGNENIRISPKIYAVDPLLEFLP
jgi:hypothetical protein